MKRTGNEANQIQMIPDKKQEVVQPDSVIPGLS